jgi:glycosyltransferase involved in cell wall biosynthesis
MQIEGILKATTKMNILLVIDGMHPRHGGPPAIVAGSAMALAERGHKVTILSIAQPGDEPTILDTWKTMLDAGIELHLCADEGLAGLFGKPKQDALIRGLMADKDVVHIHGVWSALFLVVGRIAKQLGKPYFISTHGVFDHRAMTRIKHKWLKKRLAVAMFDIRGFLENSAGVGFGSPAEAEHSWLPSKKMKITYFPNGVASNVADIAPTADQMEWLHTVVPAHASWKRSLLCRSRIHKEKGHDMLVAAFDKIAGDFPDVGILIAGMKQDAGLEAQIRGMIARSAHGDRIVLTTEMTGPRSQFLYQACDGFLAPSIAEGFSMSVVEGLANGKPMLITRYCHMPEVESHGAGIITDPNVDAIAVGLRKLLSLPDDQWHAMGTKGRNLFLEKYTWDKVAEKLDHDYTAALGASNG